MLENTSELHSFEDLGLPPPLLATLGELGYTAPSTIQALAMPLLLAGRDVVGQARTGTGKTAAFAVPLLARLDPARGVPQVLVLTPTRELALQVAEAFTRYAAHLDQVRVVAIYGGQDYNLQLRRLARGAQVVVGTPGRVMDLMRKGSLPLAGIGAVVLDEADEMLRMGFIDDVEWILGEAPAARQTALFSATMPAAVRQIASRYLREPAELRGDTRPTAAASIRQRYWLADGRGKLEILTRVLEGEAHDGVLVFVRTKSATVELAEELARRGFQVAVLSGDLAQAQRERTVERLRDGRLDLLVATDVAARGLDVERISHVINFDAPQGPETYVHRIGRTGRAGRQGESILLLGAGERHVLRLIERATRQPIELLQLPTVAALNEARRARFKERIVAALAKTGAGSGPFRELVGELVEQEGLDPLDVAAACARLAQGDRPLLLPPDPSPRPLPHRERVPRPQLGRKPLTPPVRPPRGPSRPDEGMERYRLAVGRNHGVTASNIVGAIANEAHLSSRFIGRVQIFDDHSTVDLPGNMPRHVYQKLQRTLVCRKPLAIRREPIAGTEAAPDDGE